MGDVLRRLLFLVAMFGLMAGIWADAVASDPTSIEVTVYQPPSTSNYYYSPYSSYGNIQQVARLTYEATTGVGLVKEVRNAMLDSGLQWLTYKNVASHVLPTSVHIKDLTVSATQILEQNYEFDLVNQNKLLEKYVDKQITVVTEDGEINGTLLSYDSGIVLRTEDGIVSIRSGINQIKYPVLPEGLITTPTFNWLLNAVSGGSHMLEVTYLTSGITWEADYIAVVNQDDNRVDMNGWVTVTNYAGTTFKDAKLKLVAGDIHFVPRGAQQLYAASGYESMDASYAPSAQFSEEGLFEYHLYTLQRPTTIKDSQIKQVSLFTSTGVPAEKELIFDGTRSNDIQVKLNINNTEAYGLGIPLPKGVVRVYKPDSEGQLQFLGEDSIDHTPENEQMRLYLGNAFDVVGERKVMNHKGSYCSSTDTIEIQIRNHKKEDIKVTVIEHPYCDWDITEENFQHVKESTSQVRWTLPVKANSTTTLTYVIRINCRC